MTSEMSRPLNIVKISIIFIIFRESKKTTIIPKWLGQNTYQSDVYYQLIFSLKSES